MSGWFRMYDEALDDPKVQLMDAADFKFWVNCLMLANRSAGILPSAKDIAFAFRMSEIDAISVLDRLIDRMLIDIVKGGINGRRLVIHGWAKRQFKSDVSTDRVRAFREKKRNVSETPRARSESEQSRAEQKEYISFAPQTPEVEAEPVLFGDLDVAAQIDPKNWPRINGATSEVVVDALFERWFWPDYPERKGPKKPAKLAFRRAIKIDAADNILVGENHYLTKREDLPDHDKQFTAYAVTWLNQHRWKDELREMNAELGIKDDG